MISIRALILRNLAWKLVSLLLGLLIYMFVDANLSGDLTPFSRTYSVTYQRPVSILSGTAGSAAGVLYEVTPEVVNVKVIGRKEPIKKLVAEDVLTFADLSDLGTMPPTALQRPVEVHLPPMEVEVIVEPSVVQIQFLQRPDTLTTETDN